MAVLKHKAVGLYIVICLCGLKVDSLLMKLSNMFWLMMRNSSRLIAFLDDTISSSMPVNPDIEIPLPPLLSKKCPCSTSNVESSEPYIQKDCCCLVEHCQYHWHSATAYLLMIYCIQPIKCSVTCNAGH